MAVPTTPPKIVLVFERPLPEDGVALPVGPVEELDALINLPGPISGLSEGRKV
jgi:hypothetical protein